MLLAEQKGVDIGVAEQQSGIVLGSPRELQTLFANLFNNAIRYTPTEGAIDISIRRLGDGMVVEFGSAVDAVTCAIEVQKSMADRNAANAANVNPRIIFRIG